MVLVKAFAAIYADIPRG